MRLLWIDFETTGLDPVQHQILEIAALVAELERPFEPICSAYVSALRFGTDLSRVGDGVLAMHTRNGLWNDCAESTVDVSDAERTLLDIVPGFTAAVDYEDRPTLAGSSVHFDLSFIRKHMPTLAGYLSHRVYDVSAVKLFCRSLGMPKLQSAEAHRAFADVRESIAHAKACAAWLRNAHPAL